MDYQHRGNPYTVGAYLSALLPLAHLYSTIHETFIVGTAHYMIHYTYRPSSGSSEYTRILATTQEVSLREPQNDMI